MKVFIWIFSFVLFATSYTVAADVPVETEERGNGMVYEYLVMAKALLESLSYEEFCILIDIFRSSEPLESVLKQFKIFDIEPKHVWAFIDSHVDCDGSALEKTKFRRFVEGIGRVTLNTHEKVLGFFSPRSNKAEL